MSAESLLLKEAAPTVRRSLPAIIYLFASFLRRKAAKFRAISEEGTLFRRVMLTAALALTCGFISYLLYRLDPLDGLEGIMESSQRAVWTALVPMIAVLLTYWLVRRPFPESALFTFLNLGLVTCTALVVVPGFLSLAGSNASTLAFDTRQLKAGRGAGTPVHEIYCGTIQERAEIGAMMRRLNRLSQRLAANGRLLAENGRSLARSAEELNQNTRRLDTAGTRLFQAGGPGRADPALLREFVEARRSGLAIVMRGLALQRQGHALQVEGLAWHREGVAIEERSLDLEYRQATAMYRLLGAYPVATTFLVVAIVTGLLIWLFAGVIVWKLVVKPQPTRKRKALAGASVVLVFLVLTVGMSVLRSGLLEILIQEPPSREMLEAQLRSQFEAAAPMCGRLNNHGLW